MTGKIRTPKAADSKNKKKSYPTKEAPFEVDVNDDGDISTPKSDISEDELKEEEDRKP